MACHITYRFHMFSTTTSPQYRTGVATSRAGVYHTSRESHVSKTVPIPRCICVCLCVYTFVAGIASAFLFPYLRIQVIFNLFPSSLDGKGSKKCADKLRIVVGRPNVQQQADYQHADDDCGQAQDAGSGDRGTHRVPRVKGSLL